MLLLLGYQPQMDVAMKDPRYEVSDWFLSSDKRIQPTSSHPVVVIITIIIIDINIS
jgi:hypothetical protein